MNSTLDPTISRRKQKKMAKNPGNGKFAKIQAEKAAAKRNARATLFHHILARPGRGGLSAKGAAQLQRFFSKKISQDKKPKLRDMDESASFVLLQKAADEAEDKGLSYEQLRKFAEDTMMANGPPETEKGEEEDGKAEDEEAEEEMATKDVMEVENEVVEKEEENMQTERSIEVGGKAEDQEVDVDMETERPMEVEGEGAEDLDEEQGGVALANDL